MLSPSFNAFILSVPLEITVLLKILSHTPGINKNFGPFYSSFPEPSHWTMASSNSSVCGFLMNEKMQHLSQGRNTGTSNYSAPGRL